MSVRRWLADALRPVFGPDGVLSLRAALCLNGMALLGATGVGWLVAEEGRLVLPVEIVSSDWTTDFLVIVNANLRLMAVLILGAFTLGLFTLLQLVANGYMLGFALSSLGRTSADLLPLAFRYIPIEFSAFLLAAAAAHLLAADMLGCFASAKVVRAGRIGAMLALAAALILVSAVIEADVGEIVRATRGVSE